MVSFAASLGFVIAVACAKKSWIILDAHAFTLAFATRESAATANPCTILAVKLINSNAGLFTTLASYVHIVPLSHRE